MHFPPPPVTATTTTSADPLLSLIHCSDTLELDMSANSHQLSYDWSDFPLVCQYHAEYVPPTPSFTNTTNSTTPTTDFNLSSSSLRLDSDNRKQHFNAISAPVGGSESNAKRKSHHPKKRVSFSSVIEIRNHEIILGDHPCCERLPVGLGWEYQEETEQLMDVDLLSLEQQQCKSRSIYELRLSYWQRVHLLKSTTGLTEQELIEQEQEYLFHEQKKNFGKNSRDNERSLQHRGWGSTTALSTML